MIYLIYGASGSGKSTLLEVVREIYGEKSVHVKGVTRKRRSYDEEEIMSYPEGLPSGKYDYIYSQYGYKYGISKKQISDALLNNIPHFIICNDIDTIERIKEDFLGKVVVAFLSFTSPELSLRSVQNKRGISDDEIEARVEKIDYFNSQFIVHNDIFDYMINNRYSKDPKPFLIEQARRMVDGSGDRSVLHEVIKIKELVEFHLERFSKYEHTAAKIPVSEGYLFVIMAMHNEHIADLTDILENIKSAAKATDFRAERTDDNLLPGSLLPEIFQSIDAAEIIVADLTFERPNCYYELGYAHAKGKTVFITAREGTEIHFDVSGYRQIHYNSYTKLKSDLEKVLRQYLAKKNSRIH